MNIDAKNSLWQKLVSNQLLDAAWAKVRANGGCSGGDGIAISQFQKNAALRLASLAKALENGAYRPADYREVPIPKRKGGVRLLRIPSLIDRVLHTALGMALTPVLEPQFEDSSFAYRPGRSVKQAVQAIEKWRKEGYWHVIEADIVGFFDAVRHDQLLDKLELALTEYPDRREVVDLVAHILEHQAMASGIAGVGLAQGSPLSPLLANLYLDALDEAMHHKGVRIVRFADDFIILCKKHKRAEEVLGEVIAVMHDHGLALHEDGTRLLDFDKGFEFLGHLFVRSLVLQKFSDPEEDMITLLRGVSETDTTLETEVAEELRGGYDRGERVLYIMEAGRSLGLRNLSFSVLGNNGEEIIAVNHNRVDRIEIGPRATAGWTAMDHALASGTMVNLVDGRGRLRGRVAAPVTGPAELHFAQAVAMRDDTLSVALVRKLLDARIRNQRTQLFRLNRRQENDDVVRSLASMGRHLRKLPHLNEVASLRGIEGAVAAEYWPALGLLSKGVEQPFRRQRPAQTPFNAAINYLTALLERDVYGAISAAGLHPGFGLLHAVRDRADAAVYDLMEPFRAPLSEGLAAFLFNSNRLRADMFNAPYGDAVHINSAGRGALIKGYEQALAKRVNVPSSKEKLAWRAMMRRQAETLARRIARRMQTFSCPI